MEAVELTAAITHVTHLGYDLTIGGTPGSPTLDGQITASEVRSPNPRSLPVLATTITFTTEDERLTAIGTVTEPDGKEVRSLSLSLKPHAYTERDADQKIAAQFFIRQHN